MDAFKQSFFLPAPTLTEQNLDDQAGRVFIVTGGYAGVGYELSKILYSKNGVVYIAGRSEDKANTALASIKKAHPGSQGRVEFMHLDLADLTTIKPAADRFMQQEQRLDVLTHNAGVMMPPKGSITTQGHELQIGTNCLGPFLLTQCLLPVLRKTASDSASNATRITWAASSAVDVTSPKGGIILSNAATGEPNTEQSPTSNYGQSKVGNLFLAAEFARRYPVADSHIISNSWNPGNLKSELQRHMSSVARVLLNLGLYEPVFGAYTELWAGWSAEAGLAENNGKFIWPWGRFGAYRKDIQENVANGHAAKFWGWCEATTKPFA